MKKVKLGFGFILVAVLAMVAGAVIYATLFDKPDTPNMSFDAAGRYVDMDAVIGMLDAARAADGTYCFPFSGFEIVARYQGGGVWRVHLGACTFTVWDRTG